MGTWIEIPVNRDALLKHLCADTARDPRDSDWSTRVAPSPHITLHHLGRHLTPEDVLDRVMPALRAASFDLYPSFDYQVSGWGTFLVGDRDWRVPVLLVQSSSMRALHRALANVLERDGIERDSLYDFQPHITLRAPTELPRSFRLTAAELRVVWSRDKGRERRDWSLPLKES